MKEASRYRVWQAVAAIVPFDESEAIDKQQVLEWIESEAPLYRIQSPDVPKQHLVSYFVVVDSSHSSCLLVDHIKASKWLPTGGHVELDEDPAYTVKREALEELGVAADFLTQTEGNPIFVTQTTTVGLTAGHIDVSLWYVIRGSVQQEFSYDTSEFNAIRWFTFDEVCRSDIREFDPHIHRFIRKLRSII